jgi:hypothetical protein
LGITATTETRRALSGTSNAWTKFFGQLGHLVTTSSALALKWLDQIK